LLSFGGSSLLPLSSVLKEITSANAACVTARHAIGEPRQGVVGCTSAAEGKPSVADTLIDWQG
jgi:hypothetical protein